MDITVYCIRDYAGRARYIGQTRRSLDERFKSHRENRLLTPFSVYVRCCAATDLPLTVEPLERCAHSFRLEAERAHIEANEPRFLLNTLEWMRWLRSQGVDSEVFHAWLRATWAGLEPGMCTDSRWHYWGIAEHLTEAHPVLDLFPERDQWLYVVKAATRDNVRGSRVALSEALAER